MAGVPEQVYSGAARALVDVILDTHQPGSAEWYKQERAAANATDPGFRAAVESAHRAGRHAAAEAIQAHAAEHGPKDGMDGWRWRMHMGTAARVAAGPATLDEVKEVLRSGNYAACYLDEAGRSIAPGAAP